MSHHAESAAAAAAAAATGAVAGVRVKGRKEGSYLLKSQSKSACWQLLIVSSTEKITSVVKPARIWSPAPAAALPLSSSGWAEDFEY